MEKVMNGREHYDVGILGVWSGCNYGSIMTYYALNQVISSMGKSVLMIDKPIISENDVELQDTHSRRFGREHYHISRQYHLKEMKALNELCDTFVIGSDQVWNYGISKNFGKAYYLDFAEEDKKKIAYAVSFGHGVDFAPEEERRIISGYMSCFDAISVREAEGVRLCRECYGVRAEQVIDPVFLADPKIYDSLIEKSAHKEKEPFIAAYILDPSPEKTKAILHLQAEFGGIKVINLLDGLPWLFEKNRKQMNLPNCIENLQVEDWLYYLKNAQFVLTDSCHGVSFALLFRRNFVALTNKHRGISRFASLSRLFRFEDHITANPEDIITNPRLLMPVNHCTAAEILDSERKRCWDWLHNAMTDSGKKVKMASGANSLSEIPVPAKEKLSQDFMRCKMLVTLLRDYGIRNVVLSAGSRNLNLVRLFEGNACFRTYSVIDERSAAFYAMGIALSLREPVAICCTSGTAASNYLSAVTEAFYQQVPLVVITADRYPCLLGQNEDQTIPQADIYAGVVKKSVTLPVNSGYLGDWEARRLVCEAVLEMNHHGKGPVHINIPIAAIERKKPDESALKLDQKYRKIERYTLADPRSVWDRCVKRLAGMKRIMVLYGQSFPASEEERQCMERFVRKFHCVIITDHLSNYTGSGTVLSLPILREVDQDFFDRELAPDIVITVGGRRMLNDPSLPRLRAQKHPLGHWRVAEDGKAADTYRKLTRIFECSPKYFFEYFANSDIECSHSTDYPDRWKRAAQQYVTPETTSFSQLYAVEKAVAGFPDHSCVHYGIGNTIMFANRFPINPSVEVFCNMGTNGIDGSASTYMGHVAACKKLCFLIISDLSFFYDMNSVWSKELTGNIRILLCNNNGTDLLRHLQSPSITHRHNGIAREWVKSLGFTYMEAHSREEYEEGLKRFFSTEDVPIFFEVFTNREQRR